MRKSKLILAIVFLFIYTSLLSQNDVIVNVNTHQDDFSSMGVADTSRLTWYLPDEVYNRLFFPQLFDELARKINLDLKLDPYYSMTKEMFEDTLGNLWLVSINTPKQGIEQPITLTKYSIDSSIHDTIDVSKMNQKDILKNMDKLKKIAGNKYDGRFYTFSKNDHPGKILKDFEVNKMGVWALTDIGLIQYIDDEWKIVKNIPAKKYAPNKLYSDRKDNLWVLSSEIHRYDGNVWEKFNENNGFKKFLKNCWVRDVKENDGKIYFGMYGGINIYSDGKFTTLNKNLSLPQGAPYAIIHLEENVIWATVDAGGGLRRTILRIENRTVQRFDRKNSKKLFPSKDSRIPYIIDEEKNRFLLVKNDKYGTYEKGEFVEIFDFEPTTLHSYPNLYLAARGSNYIRDDKGAIWSLVTEANTDSESLFVTSSKGHKILVVSGDKGEYSKPPKFEPQFIFRSSQNEIWVGVNVYSSLGRFSPFLARIQFIN